MTHTSACQRPSVVCSTCLFMCSRCRTFGLRVTARWRDGRVAERRDTCGVQLPIRNHIRWYAMRMSVWWRAGQRGCFGMRKGMAWRCSECSTACNLPMLTSFVSFLPLDVNPFMLVVAGTVNAGTYSGYCPCHAHAREETMTSMAWPLAAWVRLYRPGQNKSIGSRVKVKAYYTEHAPR